MAQVWRSFEEQNQLRGVEQYFIRIKQLRYNFISMQDKDQLKEILYLEHKYENMKNHLQHLKLIGKLTQIQLEEHCNLINIIAMKKSKVGDHQEAVDWLRRAIKYTDGIPKAKVITYNNLACVYREEGNYPLALLYITKAQKQADEFVITTQFEGIGFEKGLKVITDCSMNLCAILSSMKEHYKALKAIRKGLSLLRKTKQQQKLPPAYFASLYPLMKYNEGVQLEQLRKYDQAKASYSEALNYCKSESEIYEKIKKAQIFLESAQINSARRNKSNDCLRSRTSFQHKKTLSAVSSLNTMPQRKKITIGSAYLEVLKPEKKYHSIRPFEVEGIQGNQENYRTISHPEKSKKSARMTAAIYQSKKKIRLNFNGHKTQKNVLGEANS